LAVKKLIAVTLMFSGLAFTQTNKSEALTARQYYEELKAASGLNPLFTSVCFRPDSPEVFDLLGFTKEFEATAKERGLPLTPKDRKMFATGDGLLVRTYTKGVQTGEDILTHAKNPQDWYSDVQGKGHKFRLIVTLSPAGRYRRAAYVDNKMLPAAEVYGRCESIQ
jgi:hypothetical protein